nr:hypothetical protein [Sphingomonas insulae]
MYAVSALVGGNPATAQTAAPMVVEAPEQALARDADAVAALLGVPAGEALRQVRMQALSVAATDTIAARFATRLAGITVTHQPAFGITVLLTGDADQPDETIDLAGYPVRVTFVGGARATHTELVQAITAYQAAIRASLLGPPGIGIDPRRGELVVVVSGRDVLREGADALRDRLAALTGVPVRLRVVDQPALDMGGIVGGARVVGMVPGDPRHYLCTSGFVVTDGMRVGLATAAHCPDALSIRDADGREVALPFVGQWGWGHQDVQINASPEPLAPMFFADTARSIAREVTGARGRAGMRAGDVVCHRGERTGYSCSQVELTDFAPAGDLCGGACLPTWTTVAGPVCKSGDSGSPVFLGGTAYGILKGGSYRSDGSCAFYFYMSTDYLPAGWRLLTTADQPIATLPLVP